MLMEIKKLEMENIYIEKSSTSFVYGGAIYINRGKDMVLKNITILETRSQNHGIVYLDEGENIEIYNVTIANSLSG